MKRTLPILLAGLFMVALLAGCSKEDNNTPGLPQGKSMKFTITATDFQAGDYFDLTLAGGSTDGQASTFFKVNGATLDNQQVISLGESDLAAGPIVIESVRPLLVASMSIGGFSSTDGHSYTVEVAPVIDGTPQNPLTKTFNSDAESVSYEFK